MEQGVSSTPSSSPSSAAAAQPALAAEVACLQSENARLQAENSQLRDMVEQLGCSRASTPSAESIGALPPSPPTSESPYLARDDQLSASDFLLEPKSPCILVRLFTYRTPPPYKTSQRCSTRRSTLFRLTAACKASRPPRRTSRHPSRNRAIRTFRPRCPP